MTPVDDPLRELLLWWSGNRARLLNATRDMINCEHPANPATEITVEDARNMATLVDHFVRQR